LFEVEKVLGRPIKCAYAFGDRVNGTVRPIDFIRDYKQIASYQLLNGEVWIFVSENFEPHPEEICVHIKWLYKNHFWYQGTRILNRFQPFCEQLVGKPYLYEEITGVKGQDVEVSKIDAKKCPFEIGLGNGDIIIYSKNQQYSVDEVKESIDTMLRNQENIAMMRNRFLTELGSQI
jgi:hypothetical protein